MVLGSGGYVNVSRYDGGDERFLHKSLGNNDRRDISGIPFVYLWRNRNRGLAFNACCHYGF
jgi:hypothetical protein